MAKDKKYYYECVATCQMGYMATDHRKERWTRDDEPTMCLHERTFYPAGLGKKRADYLVTTSPISKRYTESIARIFEKKDLRTNKVLKLKSPTTIKFVLLEPDDCTDYVREHARHMTLRECDLASSDEEGPILQKKLGMYEIIEEDGVPVFVPKEA